MAIADEVSRIRAAKENIKQAIIDKGVEVPETTLDSYPELIEQIETQGRYQVKSATPTKEYQVITPDEGYDALERVLVAETPLETTTITPSTGAVTVVPKNDNIGFSEVTVNGDPYLSAENIKKGVSIFGVTGIYEGSGGGTGDSDFSNLGFAIDIEASGAIAKGDRIIATPNATKQIASNENGYTFSTMSEDLKVAMYNFGVNTETNSIVVCFMTDTGAYEAVTFPIDNDQMKNMLGEVGKTSANAYAQINDDGDKIVIRCGETTSLYSSSFFIVLNINRENKQLLSHKFYRFFPYSYSSEVYSDIAPYSINNIKLLGNYLLCTLNLSGTNNSTGSSTSSLGGNAFLKINGSNLSFISFTDGGQFSGVRKASDNVFLSAYGTSRESDYYGYVYLDKYVVGSSSVTRSRSTIQWNSTSTLNQFNPSLSPDGSYLAVHVYYRSSGSSGASIQVYKIDVDTLTYTSAFSFYESALNVAPRIENSGYYILTNAGIYDGTGKRVASQTLNTSVEYFNHERWIQGSKTYALVPNEGAEYIAKSMGDFTMVTDRIYGIASENLTSGMRGTARGLFRT